MKQAVQLSFVLVVIFVLVLVFVAPVYAADSVFDWDANTWPAPPIDPDQTYVGIGSPATTFTYTFSGNTNRFLTSPWSPQTNTIITGGAGETTLFIGADYESRAETITLTIDLAPYHAISVSFTLMDIDTNSDVNGTLQDEVWVLGSGLVSGVVTPTITAVSPSDVAVTNNVAASTGTSVDNTTDSGNVEVDFGSSAINQILIVYRPGALSSANPTGGGVALHDISFTPSSPTAVFLQSFQAIPSRIETNLLLAVLLLAGATIAFTGWRRRQLQRSVKPVPANFQEPHRF